MKLFDTLLELPLWPRVCANSTALTAAAATFFEQIQGPAAGAAAVLSAIWLGLQIFGWLRNEIRSWK